MVNIYNELAIFKIKLVNMLDKDQSIIYNHIYKSNIANS